MRHENTKFVLYRELKDGSYRWRLRSPKGETLAEAPFGHREKSACEAELRAVMGDYPGARVRDATATS